MQVTSRTTAACEDERRVDMTTELKLDKEDTEVLQQVLEAYLAELRYEIRNTDNSDLRSGLHLKEDRIKRMIATLDGANPRDDVSPSGER
jgi:hypothetical protein